MSWNYRVFTKKINGREYYYLKEAYYNDAGEAVSWLEDPETGYWESIESLEGAHDLMLKDIRKYKKDLLIEEDEITSSQNPANH